MTDKVKKILEKSSNKPKKRTRGRNRANANTNLNESHERRRPPRKLGPREIGRKRKSSWQPPKYNLRKVSLDGHKPRYPKVEPLPAIRERKLGPREIGRKHSYEPPNYNLRKPSLEIFKPRLFTRPRSLDFLPRKLGPRDIGRFSRRSYSPPNYNVNKIDTPQTRHRRRSSQPNLVRHRKYSWESDFSEDYYHEHSEDYSDYSDYDEKYEHGHDHTREFVQENEEIDDIDAPEPRKEFKAFIDPTEGKKGPTPKKGKKLRMALDNIDFGVMSESDEEILPTRRVRFADP